MPTVTVSSVIDAPIEKVWARIRDFNGLPSWHPRMVKSEIEDGRAADEIGCVRRFELVSGATLREKLTAFPTTVIPSATAFSKRRSRSAITMRR